MTQHSIHVMPFMQWYLLVRWFLAPRLIPVICQGHSNSTDNLLFVLIFVQTNFRADTVDLFSRSIHKNLKFWHKLRFSAKMCENVYEWGTQECPKKGQYAPFPRHLSTSASNSLFSFWRSPPAHVARHCWTETYFLEIFRKKESVKIILFY